MGWPGRRLRGVYACLILRTLGEGGSGRTTASLTGVGRSCRGSWREKCPHGALAGAVTGKSPLAGTCKGTRGNVQMGCGPRSLEEHSHGAQIWFSDFLLTLLCGITQRMSLEYV